MVIPTGPRNKKKKGKKPQKLGEFVELADELQALVDSNLPDAAERHSIKLRAGFVFKFRNGQHRRGNYAKQVNGTQLRCDTQYRQLWQFLALRGAWDSMLLLLFPKKTNQSTNCPAMDVAEICHFVRYKMNPNGMPLLDGNNDQSAPLMDVFGNAIACDGGWHAGKTMDMFGTALSCIHKVHGHDESYKPSCVACQENDETIKHGCAFHLRTRKSLAAAFRRGNPSLTTDFVNNKKTLEDPKYQARVSTQVDPGDIRAIRRATIGGLPTLAGLKFYCMVIISIKLFLRADEVIGLHTKDIPPPLFLRIAGILKCIGLSVSGKCDGGADKWFLLFADDEFPDLCPLRHFLIYIYYAGIKSGYCFPTDKDLHDENKGADGIYLKHESYHTLLNGVKRMAKNGVFEHSKTSDFRATVHIFRKGAYYFRIIASPTNEIDWVSLRYDARHSTESDMFIHVRDAATLRQTIDFQTNPEMRVSDNRKVRFQTRCAAEKNIGKATDAAGLTLFELSRQYVLSLGKGPTPSLFDAIAASQNPIDNTLEQRREKFVATLSHQQCLMFNGIVDCMLHAQNTVIDNQCLMTEKARSESAAAEAAVAEYQKAEQQRKKRKRKQPATTTTTTTTPQTKLDLKYDDGHISRGDVSKLPTLEAKIEAFKQLEERSPERDRDPTAGAKKWVIQSLRPALKCLRNHHNNDLTRYCAAWNASEWKMFHPCKGEDEQCVALLQNV